MTTADVMKVTYEERAGMMQIRVYGSRFAKGYTVTECVPIKTGRARELMIADAKKKAKTLAIPFENKA